MRRSISRTLAVLAIAVAGAGVTYPLSHGATPLAQSAGALLASASVSMSANIPSNPANTLAAQLDAKQSALDAREASLVERESSRNVSSAFDIFGIVSFVMSILLFALVGTNFYLDERRAAAARQGVFSVDLRGRA